MDSAESNEVDVDGRAATAAKVAAAAEDDGGGGGGERATVEAAAEGSAAHEGCKLDEEVSCYLKSKSQQGKYHFSFGLTDCFLEAMMLLAASSGVTDRTNF